MSASRPQFSIDDAFELSLEDTGPGLEPSGVARFGPLHFERRARFEVADEDKQSRLRYQVNRPAHLTPPSPESGRTPGGTPENRDSAGAGDRPRENLENDEDGAQASPEPDGGVSSRSGPGCPREEVGLLSRVHTLPALLPSSWTQHPLIQKNHRVVLASFLLLLLGLVLILTGVGLEVAPSPGVSSAIFFVPGFLLLVPGVYHVIFIYCAVKGHRGFQFFYLPYFEK
ncbi:hypothetical protein E5288_WYG016206 [Bos mutus]|uniref:Transmembrane protein 134 n=1 Tax=Bos mutus TaxID=72004 RepID=A0A6B0RL48_9CETA|nr:hypothetical protein [Bos mutus]